jgi:hypothetical protein
MNPDIQTSGPDSWDWLACVVEREREPLIRVLSLLSDLGRSPGPDFILIGALSLLIRGVLQQTSLWDVDLLFSEKHALRKFARRAGGEDRVRITNYEDDLMVNRGIASLHTAWNPGGAWVNVDYILRDWNFEFYLRGRTGEGPYRESRELRGEKFEISLYLAHPWDILIDKLTSPRLERELRQRDPLGTDVLHVFEVIRREGDDVKLWVYLESKAMELPDPDRPFRNLRLALASAEELGRPEIRDRVPERILVRPGPGGK